MTTVVSSYMLLIISFNYHKIVSLGSSWKMANLFIQPPLLRIYQLIPQRLLCFDEFKYTYGD